MISDLRSAPPEVCVMTPLIIIDQSVASSSTRHLMSNVSSPTIHCRKMASAGKILTVSEALCGLKKKKGSSGYWDVFPLHKSDADKRTSSLHGSLLAVAVLA